MRRRILLLAAPAVIAVAPSSVTAAPRRVAPAQRRVAIQHAATGARFSGVYHDGRSPDPRAMLELSEVLADTRSGAVMPFDPLAIDVLWEVSNRAGMTGTLTILSGYRTLATNVAV